MSKERKTEEEIIGDVADAIREDVAAVARFRDARFLDVLDGHESVCREALADSGEQDRIIWTRRLAAIDLVRLEGAS